MLQKIIVPVDGSDNSIRALEYAVELGRKFDSTITVVNVTIPYDIAKLPPRIPRNEIEAVKIKEAETEAKRKTALALAEHRVEELGGYAKIKYMPLIGIDPAERVVELSETQDADTIVVGNRGLGTFFAFILGSVSSKLIQLSKVPVILVK
jgi:nucleotide-binding universal stress UspA family protein